MDNCRFTLHATNYKHVKLLNKIIRECLFVCLIADETVSLSELFCLCPFLDTEQLFRPLLCTYRCSANSQKRGFSHRPKRLYDRQENPTGETVAFVVNMLLIRVTCCGRSHHITQSCTYRAILIIRPAAYIWSLWKQKSSRRLLTSSLFTLMCTIFLLDSSGNAEGFGRPGWRRLLWPDHIC